MREHNMTLHIHVYHVGTHIKTEIKVKFLLQLVQVYNKVQNIHL